jgi:type IV pilus assembly protein PilW
VEIMVGLVIGMLSMIVIMQVFSIFEGQKRATTGGSDVQNNGAIALYGLQQDIQQSGYDTATFNLASCNIALPSGGTVIAAPVVINPAASIIPAGDANTDTLLITYGNSTSTTEGDTINTQNAQTQYSVTTSPSFTNSDYVVAEQQIQPIPCNLSLDQVNSINGSIVTVQTGSAAMDMSLGTLYNLGQSPKFLAYAIRNGTLTVCDYMVNNCGDATKVNDPTFWVPIAADIVSMRAEYGHDTATTTPPPAGQTSYIVDTYDQASPATACGWVRAPVVRIALVARNGQPDKNIVTTAANQPIWDGNAGAPINLSAITVPANFTWQNYRYKVFQTTIPIRNTTMTAILALQGGAC